MLCVCVLHTITYIILVKSFIFRIFHIRVFLRYFCFSFGFLAFFCFLFATFSAPCICLFHISWQHRARRRRQRQGQRQPRKSRQTVGVRRGGACQTLERSKHPARIHYCVIFLHYFIINQQNALNAAAEKLQKSTAASAALRRQQQLLPLTAETH